MSAIRSYISELLAQGIPIGEILVNDGDSSWGEDAAVTKKIAAELIAEWRADGQDCSDLGELTPAADWLERHPQEED